MATGKDDPLVVRFMSLFAQLKEYVGEPDGLEAFAC